MNYLDDEREVLPLFHGTMTQLGHGCFTRHGGTSGEPFATNNMSFGIGDSLASVIQNRQRLKSKLSLKCLVSAHQVHGDRIFHVEPGVKEEMEVDGYDALITREAGTGLLVQHADCQAVLLFDPIVRVVAAIHNGWRGSVTNIVAKTIKELVWRYDSRPGQLLAAVGPSLGPCCSEFVNFRKELPKSFLDHKTKENYFDFWQITTHQLLTCGVQPDLISIAGVCTSCSPDYYSYRRACREGNGKTGRNGTVIALL